MDSIPHTSSLSATRLPRLVVPSEASESLTVGSGKWGIQPPHLPRNVAREAPTPLHSENAVVYVKTLHQLHPGQSSVKSIPFGLDLTLQQLALKRRASKQCR